MRPELMEELLRVCREYNSGLSASKIEFNNNLTTEHLQNIACITVKNHYFKKGLSAVLHSATETGHQLRLRGPVGKGLAVRNTGTHVAFAAGMGALSFLDLASHLARRHLGQLREEEEGQLGDNFKFVFYASFTSEQAAVGLHLC